MKFIITIDDGYKETLELFLEKGLSVPVVVGVPTGLMDKKFEGREVASEDLIFQLTKRFDIELASHGYYHTYPNHKFRPDIYRVLLGIIKFPDKFNYFRRVFHFVFYGADNNKDSDPVYKNSKEVISSRVELEKIFNQKINTFICPGGYVDSEILDSISKNYNQARNSEVGINFVSDLRDDQKRYKLKTISFSKYTNFSRIEKYYKKLLRSEKKGEKEILIIESYHLISENENPYLYSNRYKDFKHHCEFLGGLGEICNFNEASRG